MYLKDKWWTSSFGIICKIFIENFQTNEFSTQEKKFEVSENQTETKEFSQIYLLLFYGFPILSLSNWLHHYVSLTSFYTKFNCLTSDIKDDRCSSGRHFHNGCRAITTPINSNYSLITRLCLLRSSSELDIPHNNGEDDADSICHFPDAIRGQSDVTRLSAGLRNPNYRY